MSETDSFIQEVTEEVRQDQMLKFWKKWGPYVIGGIAVVVGGAAYWSWSEAQVKAAAETRGGTFIAADPEVLDHQLALPEKIDGPANLLAELAAAGALAGDGQSDAAAEKYAAIAADPAVPMEYSDLAALQHARLTGGSDSISKLGDLAADGRPYRLLALELRGARHLVAGDADAAHSDWRAIVTDPAATPALRQRAVAALTSTGGSVADPAG